VARRPACHAAAAWRSLADDIHAGGYWLPRPGPNCSVAIAYAGAMAPEAIAAAVLLAERRRDIGVLAVTSVDRPFSGWRAADTNRTKF
jgi:pyruvate dehydrogenase E1 component